MLSTVCTTWKTRDLSCLSNQTKIFNLTKCSNLHFARKIEQPSSCVTWNKEKKRTQNYTYRTTQLYSCAKNFYLWIRLCPILFWLRKRGYLHDKDALNKTQVFSSYISMNDKYRIVKLYTSSEKDCTILTLFRLPTNIYIFFVFWTWSKYWKLVDIYRQKITQGYF